jgi:hypothetical protein
MEVKEAIMAFSQSEKIKAGLIWVSQTLEFLKGLPEGEKKGAEKVSHTLLHMIGHEVSLAKAVAGNNEWDEIEAFIDRAIIMVNSGVGEEATIHLTKALSKTTTIGHRAMSLLKEKNLLDE